VKKRHRVHKYFFILTICVLVISLLLPGCGGGAVVEEEEEVTTGEEEEEEEEEVTTGEEEEEEEEPAEPGEPEIVLPFIQTIVGSRINFIEDGSVAWGDNIVKIVATENKIFTYAMDTGASPCQVFLYSKTDGEDWQEGEAIDAVNPPNLLVDSQGFVHLIGFEPYTTTENWDGRIFHVKFDQPEAVSGSYTFEYLTPDTREIWPPTLDTAASFYIGAAIGEDDTTLVVYMNSIHESGSTPPHSLGARIYDPVEKKWSYESVAANLTSRFCYLFVAVTDEYFHVLAVEDDYDEDLEFTGYPFRFGMVKHFQRARDSDEWVESTLIDFNPTLSKLEISEIWLRNYELLVDSEGTVHVLILYCANADGEPCSCKECEPRAYHYWKEESATEWHSEPAIDTTCGWLRLWEREDGQLFYVYSKWNEQICLIPQGTTKRYIISDLVSLYIDGPQPFIAAARGGTRPSSTLNLVIFSGTKEVEGVVISVDTSSIE